METYFGQLLLVFIGATISIILTLGAAFFMDYHKRQDDRWLSAMMVMSNIEKFSRNLEEIADYLGSNDSVATWLLNKPIEELELLPERGVGQLGDASLRLAVSYLRQICGKYFFQQP